jgi:hypothetical protein
LFWGFGVAKFTYVDTVTVVANAPNALRPVELASVIGITEEPRQGAYFEQFPPGAIYLVEYEDGVAVSFHESHLELLVQ